MNLGTGIHPLLKQGIENRVSLVPGLSFELRETRDFNSVSEAKDLSVPGRKFLNVKSRVVLAYSEVLSITGIYTAGLWRPP